MIQLVARAGSASLFRNTGVPYFTLRNWASQGRKVVTVDELLECRKSDLIIKNLKLTAEKNATQALLTLVLSTMKVFGFSINWKRLPSETSKIRLLSAIAKARKVTPLKDCLALMNLSPSRFHNWVRRQKKCRLKDYSTCPKSTPTKLTDQEQKTIERLYHSKEYSHFSIRALSLYALIMGYISIANAVFLRINDCE